MFAADASVPTVHASRYLQQLCKHWSHELQVEFDARHGTIVFPRDAKGADWPGDAVVSMTAGDSALLCRIEASAVGQRDVLKTVLARHLDRFAFRETPLEFDWTHPVAGSRTPAAAS